MNPSLDEINSALVQKNKNQSSIKISVKLKKLEIAGKLALSKGKKTQIQGQAVELLKEVDTKIKSLALQKFVVRKVKRLQALGEKRDRINELIIAMHQSRATVFDSTIVDDAKRAVLGFGIDKKFIGLTAEEVLNKVNAVPKDTNKKSKTTKKPGTSASSNKQTAQQTQSSSKSDKGTKNTLKISSSTGTVSEVQRNNERIYDYLVQSGEYDIADYVLGLMTAQKNDEDPKKLSEVQRNTEEIKKLSVVNSGIREELEEIKENMVDEQDTSMDLPKKLQQKKQQETLAKENPNKEEKRGSSFLDAIMSFIGGAALGWFWKLLRGVKGITEFAGTIIRSGWKAISGLLGKLFSSKFALAFAAAFKGAFDSAYSLASKAAMAAIEFLKTGFSKLVDLVRKIPGIDKLIPESWGSGSKKTSKSDGPAKTSDKPSTKSGDKPSKLSSSKMGEVDDLAKKASKEAAKDTIAKKGGKILPKLLKFAKPIPLIGAAITAGTAIYAAYDGYENAAEITGKRNPTTEQRYIAAAANVADDVTFGVLSSKTAAAKIMEWVSSDEIKQTREKYEALGIITYNRIAHSSVNNWDALRRLSPEEIQKIIDIDDWSNKDLAELKKAKAESRARALTKHVDQDQESNKRPAQVSASTASVAAEVPEKAPAPEVPTPSVPNEPKKTSQEPVVAKDTKPAKISENAGKRAMVQALDKAKIYDPVARAAIMAQVATESGGFRVLSENLNYRTGTLTKIWPRKFPAGDAHEVAAGGPVRVAERVYSSRMGNGPEGSGDAWNYRGRGFIQLTGKNNYQRFGYASDPEALTNPETAAESALKYMGGFRGDWGDIAAVSKYVNGGKIGLEERIKWFKAMKADPEVTVPSAPEKTQTSTNTDVPKIPSGAGAIPSAVSSASSSTKPAPITGDTSSQVASAPSATPSATPSSTPTKSDGVTKLSAVMKARPGVDLNINKGFEERVAAMAAAFKEQTGKTLTATSGLRSNEKQKALWDAKLAETGSPAETRKWVAEPAPPLGNGRGSMHMSGLALDINSKGSEGINKLAGPATASTGWLERFGLTRPVKNEDWHVQPSDAKISTPDNPDKPGEPIAVPDKAGKALDVATGKNDPSISTNAQAVPTAKLLVDGAQNLGLDDPSDHPAPGTLTPEKTQPDIAMLDSAFIKQAKIETDTRTMHASMASLAKEYAKASGTGNREKMENIRQAIHAKQSEFRGTQSPVQEATVADKSILAKDKAIQATEQTYTAALANTQSYDMKTYGASGTGNSSRSVTINNVNNQQKDEKTNPFEMFDNLQEA